MKLALVGGEEFADGFESVHEALLRPLKDGRSRGAYLPTCAAHDGLEVVNSWRQRAQERLSPYVARVDSPLVVDKASAHDGSNVAFFADADWIYLGGGFPNIGMDILENTPVMNALQLAARRGALIIGASAGAMLMCDQSIAITPEMMHGAQPTLFKALGWVPNTLCLPHFNRNYARRFLDQKSTSSSMTLLGIDEQTALVNLNGVWEVLGKGMVTVISPSGKSECYASGQSISLQEAGD